MEPLAQVSPHLLKTYFLKAFPLSTRKLWVISYQYSDSTKILFNIRFNFGNAVLNIWVIINISDMLSLIIHLQLCSCLILVIRNGNKKYRNGLLKPISITVFWSMLLELKRMFFFPKNTLKFMVRRHQRII